MDTDMLACHKSQMGWLNYQTRCDMMEQATCMARSRRMQCGVKYAEVFSGYEAWPRKTDERLLP